MRVLLSDWAAGASAPAPPSPREKQQVKNYSRDLDSMSLVIHAVGGTFLGVCPQIGFQACAVLIEMIITLSPPQNLVSPGVGGFILAIVGLALAPLVGVYAWRAANLILRAPETKTMTSALPFP